MNAAVSGLKTPIRPGSVHFRAYLGVHHYVIESTACHHFQSCSVTHVGHGEEVRHQTLDLTAVPVFLGISEK